MHKEMNKREESADVLYGTKEILTFLGHNARYPSNSIRRLCDAGAPIHWPTRRKPYAIKTELLQWIQKSPTHREGGKR